MSKALPIIDAQATPDVAILVVNWNTCGFLAECLQSIQDSNGLSIQTVIVDNASTDGSAEMVRERFPQVTLLALSENLGFVGGNNRAYELADPQARYVLLLNPDAVLRPGALQTLVDWMDDHSNVGACGPLLLESDGTLQPSWSRFPTLWSEAGGRLDRRFRGRRRPARLTVESFRAITGALPVDWVGGACLLVRRRAIEQCRGETLLDPDYHMYSEETDLCYRLSRAGWSTHLHPQSEVIHYGGQSSKQAPARTLRLLYRSKYLFFQKHYGPGRARLLKFCVGCASGLKWLAFGLLGLLPTRRRALMKHQRDQQWTILQWLRAQGLSGREPL